MLYVVATPIGSFDELSLKAIDVLKKCDIVICESTKETSKLLKYHEITQKKYELLNEHSTDLDLIQLAQLCETQTCALVSDCGTPVFCDPGSSLIKICREKSIPVKSILGPSSLMGALSLSSQRLDEFVFRGFLPTETSKREAALKKLTGEKRAIILMDTPYRLKKILQDMNQYFSNRNLLLCLDLSSDEEVILEGKIKDIIGQVNKEKAEFMLLIYPETQGQKIQKELGNVSKYSTK